MSDLIRREDAIEILSERAESLRDMQGDLGGACRGAMRIIELLPSVESEHKKGKWIDDFCSCCGLSKYYFFKMVDDKCTPYGMWNFCPNCGADMREEDILICGNCGCQLQRTYDGIDINYCPECGYKLEWE